MEQGRARTIAERRSEVLWSSQAVDNQLQEAVGSSMGKVVETARRLGIDQSIRRVKQNPVFKKRWKHFQVRKKLINKMGRAGKWPTPGSTREECYPVSSTEQNAALPP